MQLIPIVEGHGEDDAVPVILRAYLAQRERFDVAVARPYRVKRNAVVRVGEIERETTASLALRREEGLDDRILVLLDADDDCPAQLPASLEQRAQSVVNVPVSVVFANREAEAWLLADIENIAAIKGWDLAKSAPADPDAVRGAKEWLRRNVGSPNPYSPTQHQAAWFAALSIEAARSRSRSFDKFCRTVDALVT